MKRALRLATVAVVAGTISFSLGGCATNSQGQPTIGGVSATAVQAAILRICQYIPTPSSLNAILTAAASSGIPSLVVVSLGAVDNIANAVCASVTSPTAVTTATMRRQVTKTCVPIANRCVPVVGQFVH